MRFNEFTTNWQSTTLKNVCEYRKIRRTTEKKNYVSTENIMQNFQGVERFISAEYISGDGFNKNDILMGNIRPYLKKVCFADFDGVCNADVLVFNSKTINPKFLYYVLANDNFINYVMSSVKGSKMPRGDKNFIMQYPLSLPSETEQLKISDFIGCLTKRIQVQNKIISKYETLIKGIIDCLLNKKEDNYYTFKDLYLKAGEGGTPTTDNDSYYENGTIPFIKIDDLSQKYIKRNSDYITYLGLEKSAAWLIPSNSVIFSNGATIGRISINTYPIATKQGVLGIVPSPIVMTEYLYYYMKTTYFRGQVRRITVKGTMDCAYLKDLNSIICHIPEINHQEKRIALLTVLDEKIACERMLLQKLKEQKKYLLSKMFI